MHLFPHVSSILWKSNLKPSQSFGVLVSCVQIFKNKQQVTMSKRLQAKVKDERQDEETKECRLHHFTPLEVDTLRKSLLVWYDANHRTLPWREIACTDRNRRAYAVWVSEIMLQQTQVSTVIDYYNKWMKTWPTLQDLAAATVEEVNTMWSGLGYYSRGRRLLEGAQKVVNELDGEMPDNAEDLQRLLPGVGRYTAGAIASIAFGQVTGLVDGNVMRVLSRLRLIGAYITLQNVTDRFWSLANSIVDTDRPGDFNQAMMELGATVCTPKAPNCSHCPVKSLCHAFDKVEHKKGKSIKDAFQTLTKSENKPLEIPDIENAIPGCLLCLPSDQKWDASLGVMNLPRKPPKNKARLEDLYVLVIKRVCKSLVKDDQYLMVQRPEKGLLAGLWEFPIRSCTDVDKTPKCIVRDDFDLDAKHFTNIRDCGQATHMFSHIHHNYHVMSVETDDGWLEENRLNPEGRKSKWISGNEMKEAAISTGMRKVFKLCQDTLKSSVKSSGKRRSEEKSDQKSKKSQKSISSFFRPSKGQ